MVAATAQRGGSLAARPAWARAPWARLRGVGQTALGKAGDRSAVSAKRVADDGQWIVQAPRPSTRFNPRGVRHRPRRLRGHHPSNIFTRFSHHHGPVPGQAAAASAAIIARGTSGERTVRRRTITTPATGQAFDFAADAPSDASGAAHPSPDPPSRRSLLASSPDLGVSRPGNRS